MELGQLTGDVLAFVDLVVGVKPDDPVTLSLVGPQRLRLAAEVVGDDGVCRIEDGLGRAVVLLEQHHRGVGERILELDDVADVGPSEPVDRLVRITDDGHVAVGVGQPDDQLVLDAVCVLVLVDQEVFEPLLVGRKRLRRFPEEPHGVEQQIVEVHRRGGLQPTLVLGVDVRRFLLDDDLGPLAVLSGVEPFVLGRADHVLDRARLEPFGVETEIPYHVPDKPDRVRLVIDREVRREVDHAGVPAQDSDAGRVERRHPHLLGHGPNEDRDPLLHLVGRLVGEGDGQDFERRHALVDQPGDPPGQDPGLAGAGAGHNQQRTTDVGDRIELRRVQPFGQVRCGVVGSGHHFTLAR